MSLRSLPSVDKLLEEGSDLISAYGRPLSLAAIRATQDENRIAIRAGSETPSIHQILARVEAILIDWTKTTLQPVVNATGVILHTNLGRAPLSAAAIKAMDDVSRGYSTLEYDLETGKRGSRFIHAESVLNRLTGSGATLVVNNCASAVLLVLTALARRKSVIIPRSQLIEIGGGFRVPDVMKQSGARLVEIGTTNKVRISDYEEALDLAVASNVMRAHRSNFRLVGFTEEPELKDIIATAHKYGAIFVDDLGSGALLDTNRFGLQHEPMVQESLAAGADVVMFSGDKLTGGPQAGIIVGNPELMALIKKHPLARAVRADKTCLAGLTATLLHYLKNEAELEIPVWRMVSLSLDVLKMRVEAWQKQLEFGEVLPGESTLGGGSLPGYSFPTWLLSIQIKSPDKYLTRMRKHHLPVIARAENGCILLDPRTVMPEQDNALIECLKAVFHNPVYG
jgi:L-seryl-tRNA(Ser) seleniumtransferase